jgi:predicted phage-related endonuclease
MENKVTLTDMIRNILETEHESSVKDILVKIQNTIEETQLSMKVDYRKVYRHLRTCATKTARGQFTLRETTTAA